MGPGPEEIELTVLVGRQAEEGESRRVGKAFEAGRKCVSSIHKVAFLLLAPSQMEL